MFRNIAAPKVTSQRLAELTFRHSAAIAAECHCQSANGRLSKLLAGLESNWPAEVRRPNWQASRVGILADVCSTSPISLSLSLSRYLNLCLVFFFCPLFLRQELALLASFWRPTDVNAIDPRTHDCQTDAQSPATSPQFMDTNIESNKQQ